MNGWFGESWGAPVCEADAHRATPVGAFCFSCDEPVERDDQGFIQPQYGLDGPAAEHDPLRVLLVDGHQLVAHHLECQLRNIFGSVGHIEGRCSCAGGDEEDPPGLSRREAARAAVAAFERKHGHRVGG